jgi:hypothetical protein
MIIAPHIALLALPSARALLPDKFFTDSSVEFAGAVYTYLWGVTLFGGGLLLARMSFMSYNYSGFRGVWDALLEHPAVSSIAFDIVFCWIAWTAWWITQGRNGGNVLVVDKNEEEKADAWAGAGSARAARVNNDSGIRRR